MKEIIQKGSDPMLYSEFQNIASKAGIKASYPLFEKCEREYLRNDIHKDIFVPRWLDRRARDKYMFLAHERYEKLEHLTLYLFNDKGQVIDWLNAQGPGTPNLGISSGEVRIARTIRQKIFGGAEDVCILFPGALMSQEEMLERAEREPYIDPVTGAEYRCDIKDYSDFLGIYQ
jgi:hypothetical protein